MAETVQTEAQYDASDDELQLAESIPIDRAGVVKSDVVAELPYKHELERKIQITDDIHDKKQAVQLQVVHRRKNQIDGKAEYQLRNIGDVTSELHCNGKWYREKDLRRLY